MQSRFNPSARFAILALSFAALASAQAQTSTAKPPAATPAATLAATPVKADPDKPPPAFDAVYMKNANNIKIGQAIWAQQCTHCHGAKAYPGKAPKLKPGGYTPEFVFDRTAFGFKAMPPWKDVFTLEEIKSVVAYVKSDSFSP